MGALGIQNHSTVMWLFSQYGFLCICDKTSNSLCPIAWAVSMVGFRQNHTKPSGCTELVDRMECWVIKVRWGPESCRHNMDHKANKAFKPMTSAVYFEKELHWWTKSFYIVIEAVGGTFACQYVRATVYNCKNGPYDSKVKFFFLDGIISFSQLQGPACCSPMWAFGGPVPCSRVPQ